MSDLTEKGLREVRSGLMEARTVLQARGRRAEEALAAAEEEINTCRKGISGISAAIEIIDDAIAKDRE